MPSVINATTTNGVAISPDNSGSLQLATNNGTTAVTINTSQSVGIGTTNPINPFVVSNGGAGGFEVATASNNISVNSYNRNSSAWIDLAYNANQHIFNRSGTSEAMRITSGGDLLVNTTTSYGRTTLLGNNSSVPLACWNNAGTSGFFTMISFRNNAGTSEIGNVLRTNDNTISFNNTSDYRLKENIQPMIGALDKVARLKPVTYTWKSDGTPGQGFIAHELQEVVPDAVAGEKDAINEDGSIKPQGIDTSFLVATLTAAIQEQQAQIEQLKAEVQALKGAA